MNGYNNPWKIRALVFIFISLLAGSAVAQKEKETPGPLVKRATTRHETYRLQYGGTVTLSAAPAGSIVIEGWSRNEVDVTASIELQAPTAADLDRLAAVNTFVVDADVNHIRILTSGTHDRAFMKRMTKNFPKALIGLPWKIDYHIKIPELTDLTVDAGVGPITLSGVEGTLRLNAVSGVADLSLTGGLASVLIQSGTANVHIPTRSWHGLGAEVKVGTGTVNVDLMPGFSGDIDADALQSGEVKVNFAELKPREQSKLLPTSIRARAGNGGGTLSFTVGAGNVVIRQMP